MNMPLVLLNRRRRGFTAFSPSSLFSTTAIGIWLDPSDLSTMFSDRAGTTPVTAPGTVVGLRLDKSKGLALGAELVANGDFAAGTTGWTLAASATVSGGSLSVNSVTTENFCVSTGTVAAVQKTYLISFDVTRTSGAFSVFVGQVAAANQLFAAQINTSGSRRGYVLYGLPGGGSNTIIFRAEGGFTGSIDNISVRELPGNHATAPTDAARPIYGVEPKGGRRNLLLQTESFGDIAWTKTSLTVSGNQVSYAGGLGGTKECVQLVTIPGGTASKVLTAYVTVSGSGTFRLKNTHSGVLDNFSANVTATGTRQTIALTVTNSASAGNGLQAISIINSTGDAAFSLTVHEFQLELGSTATNYQRVLSAYDVTESGVPTCHYVQYDGSDDSMSTSAIDFTATDKMSVFAGVRKLSDAVAYGTVAELGTWGTNNGSFVISAPAGAGQPRYEFALRGTANAGYQPQTYAAPISNVLTSLMNIGAATKSEELVPRIDGVVNQTNDNLVSAGTGNFGNYALSFGRNKAATLAFNGRDYGIIVVGKAASAGEITDTETWLAAKTAQVTI